MMRLATTALLLVMTSCSGALAQSASLLPDVPKGKGDACVADSKYMRVNHMNLLQHDRDETVLLGDRKIKYSLKQCIECHEVKGPDALPVGITSEKHFCRACHDYVAVKIDCFQCHNSKPDGMDQTQHSRDGSVKDMLAAFLSEAQK